MSKSGTDPVVEMTGQCKECPLCGESFASPARLKTHLNKCHTPEQIIPHAHQLTLKHNLFYCEMHEFVSVAHLNKDYQCTECSKVAKFAKGPEPAEPGVPANNQPTAQPTPSDAGVSTDQQTPTPEQADDSCPFSRLTGKHRSMFPRFENRQPTQEEMKEQLPLRHKAAKRLKRLPPSDLWTTHLKREWRNACTEFAMHMKTELDSECPNRFTQLVLDWLELPSIILSQHLTGTEQIRPDLEHDDPTGSEAGGNRTHRAVKKYAYWNQWSKAMQQAVSKGTVKPTQDTLRIMREMHPERKEPLIKHSPSVKQVRITTKNAKRYLWQIARTDKSAVGVLGWSADFLFNVRGPRDDSSSTASFLQQTARLISRLTHVEDVPDSVAFILTCGELSALNKLYPEEQEERIKRGEDPKLRPVNIGVCILKWTFKLVLMSDQAEHAIKELGPIQMALKTPRGTEIVGHLFRALYEKHYAIYLTDYTIGFNDFMRQAMLDAVEKRCPALTGMFNKYYALSSMCFYTTDDGIIHIVWSEQGSRMGCTFGSFGFDITVQDIFEAVGDRHPQLLSKALTDDYNLAIPKPENGDFKKAFGEIAELARFIADKSMEIAGLKLNFGKCHLLLPKQWPDPPTEGEGALPKGITVDREGVRMAGAPIGTDKYVVKFICSQVDAIKTRIEALSDIDPQVGFNLLRLCTGVPAFNYFLQVTPPNLIAQVVSEFDRMVETSRMRMLTVTGQPPPAACSKGRMRRAHIRAQLPVRLNGCGHTSAEIIAPGAWWASVAGSSAVDEQLRANLDGLQRFVQPAHNMIIERLGGIDKARRLKQFPADDPLALVEGSFYVEIYENQPSLKLQKEISSKAQLQVVERLRAVESNVGVNGITQSDYVAAQSRARPSKLFMAPLSIKTNRIEPLTFVGWVRFFLHIPQLQVLGNATTIPGLDYEAETCVGKHRKGFRGSRVLDLHANHACGLCPSASAAQHAAHTRLKWALHYLVLEAGAYSKRPEPATHMLLGPPYTAESCKKRFRKGLSKAQKRYVQSLEDELEQHREQGGETSAQRRDDILEELDNLPDCDKGGLRVDVAAVDHQTEESLWIDVTIIHPTCQTRLKKEFKHAQGVAKERSEGTSTYKKLIETRDKDGLQAAEGNVCVVSHTTLTHGRHRRQAPYPESSSTPPAAPSSAPSSSPSSSLPSPAALAPIPSGSMAVADQENKDGLQAAEGNACVVSHTTTFAQDKHQRQTPYPEFSPTPPPAPSSAPSSSPSSSWPSPAALAPTPSGNKQCSMAVADQENAKMEVYAELTAAARRQVDNGMMKKAPTFKPAVLTTLGEIGPGFVHVQEWLTRIYGRRLGMEGPRMDGRSAKELTAAYRTNFRNRVLWCMASKVAGMMRSSGQGPACLRKSRCAGPA